MNRRRFLASSSFAALAPLSTQAEEVVEALSGEWKGLIVLTGDSFRIGDQEYKLVDIAAPAAKEPDFSDMHLYANESEYALRSLIPLGADEIREVDAPDRWGRKIVIPSTFDGYEGMKSFQEYLISDGAAWVLPQSDEYEFIKTLLREEEKARRVNAGLWQSNAYRVLGAVEAEKGMDQYRLVEGVVLKTAQRKDYTYLNFGADYKTDFTATVRTSIARKWKELGLDLLALEGEAIRVRGYISWINGPSMTLTHPLQIERLLRQT